MILAAAQKALAKRGYQDLRLDEVAGLAGVAKGTLYLYFKDKMSLLAGVYLDLIEELDRRLDVLPKEGTGSDRLKAALGTLLELIDENESFILSFIGGHPDLERSPSGKKLNAGYAGILRRLSGLFSACAREGCMRRVDPVVAGMLFFKSVEVFMERKKLLGDKTPLKRRRRAIMDLLLYGLGKTR